MSTPESQHYGSKLCFDLSVTIADGEQTSNAVDLRGTRLMGIIVPAGLEGTLIGVQASDRLDGTYYDVHGSNTTGNGPLRAIAAASSRYITFDVLATHDGFEPIRFLKLKTTGQNQTGDITITLITKAL